MQRFNQGYLLIMGAATMWGSIGLFAKFLYQAGWETNEVVFFRALIGFLLTLIWWKFFTEGKKVERKHLPYMALYGLVSVALFYMLYFYAIKELPIAIAAVLLYTAPIWVNLLARVLYKEALTVPKLLALSLSLVGVAFVTGFLGTPIEGLSTWGLLAGLGAAIAYGLYGIIGKKALEFYPPSTVLVYALGFGSLFLFLAMPPTKVLVLDFSGEILKYVLISGIIGTFLPYVFFTTGLTYVPVSNASIVAMIEPVIAAIAAYLVLGEALTALQIGGAVLVLTGAALAQKSNKTT